MLIRLSSELPQLTRRGEYSPLFSYAQITARSNSMADEVRISGSHGSRVSYVAVARGWAAG